MGITFYRNGLESLLAGQGVGILVAFGSRVSGKERDDSDLDLGALRADGRPFRHRELADLLADLQERTPHHVDLVDLASADTLLRYEVLKNHERLFVDDRERWVLFVAGTLIEYDALLPFLDDLIAGVARRAQQPLA
jgi:predicted nucleotidyltransferase